MHTYLYRLNAALTFAITALAVICTAASMTDMLHNSSPSVHVQFQALRSMVQANPQILQPMLQELGKQNPQLLRLINDNQGEFLRLINEAGAENAEGDLLGHLAEAMPQSITITPEEREAIERLEALGFDRARVIEAFLACDRNELLAANYLLEDPGDNEDKCKGSVLKCSSSKKVTF